jgi:hypothetical protein
VEHASSIDKVLDPKKRPQVIDQTLRKSFGEWGRAGGGFGEAPVFGYRGLFALLFLLFRAHLSMYAARGQT